MLAGVTVVVLLASADPADAVVKATSGVTILVVLLRQLMMSHTNATLAGSLERSERHFRTMVDGTRDVFIMVDDDGRISYASPASTELFGSSSGAVGRTACHCAAPVARSGSHHQRVRADDDRHVGPDRGGDPATGRHPTTVRMRSAIARLTASSSRCATSATRWRCCVAWRLPPATTCSTRLPNRLSFETALREQLQVDGSASVVFMDLDGFKRVNDTSGHAAGDALLVQVAHRLRASVDDCLVARFGGDEFAILLRRGVSQEGALVLATHAQQAIAGTYHVAGNEITIRATAGLSFADHGSVEEVMRNADLALYEAKADGHGALRVFDQTMYDREVRRVELDERLRRALSSEDLSVYYQPVLDLQTGTITAAEALVRWFDGEQAVLAPDELISSGRIHREA